MPATASSGPRGVTGGSPRARPPSPSRRRPRETFAESRTMKGSGVARGGRHRRGGRRDRARRSLARRGIACGSASGAVFGRLAPGVYRHRARSHGSYKLRAVRRLAKGVAACRHRRRARARWAAS